MAIARVCDKASLHRASQPSEPTHGVFGAAVCVVAQGRKQVLSGGSVLVYDADELLVASVDLPVIGQVVEASPEQPYPVSAWIWTRR
jgi:hypothetical protein